MYQTTYLKIEKKDIPKELNYSEQNGTVCLQYGKAYPFYIKLPIILNEDLAKIAAMILDGCVGKNYSSVMFSQKKDLQKVKEFADICYKYFGISGRITEKNGCLMLHISRSTFSRFLHSCLDIHKSDEDARIPKWIWNSPENVVITYLRYAFAMEGSVYDYRKGNDVRFHSVDLSYLQELCKLLNTKFDIRSKILKYYIKDYGYKYMLYFGDKENVTKFLRIGFALKSHQKRLEDVVKNFKSKAWEITLVKLLDLKEKFFSIRDVHKLFNYLCRRAIHARITTLIQKRYLSIDKKGYFVTQVGRKKARELKNSVNITRLRTNPELNEQQIFSYIQRSKTSYRNEITRNLKINNATVRDVLNRLINKNKIELIKVDKLQRKFYAIKKKPKRILALAQK